MNLVVGEAVPMTSCPFVGFAKEIYDNRAIKPEDTMYYKWIEDLVEKHSCVWGYIKTKEDIIARVERFKWLIDSLEGGYDEVQEDATLWIEDKKYGGLTAVRENGKVLLIDGTHRVSIMIMLGYDKVTLDIYKCE